MSMSDRDGTSCAIRNQHNNRCHFPYHLPLLLPLTPKKKDLTLLKWTGTCGEPFLRGSCESSKSRSKRLSCTLNVTHRKTLASKRSPEATSSSSCASRHHEVELPTHILEQRVQQEKGMLGLEGAKPGG